MNKKELGFSFTGKDAQPLYISSKELLEAARDCLSHKIIETDREKLLSVLSKIDAHEEETIFEDVSFAESVKYFFVFLICNISKTKTDIWLFLKHDVPKELIGGDVVLLGVDEKYHLQSQTQGSIINAERLLILVELGNVWGYVKTKKGIEAVEVCSPTEDLYDWKPSEEFSKKPFIRNPKASQ